MFARVFLHRPLWSLSHVEANEPASPAHGFQLLLLRAATTICEGLRVCHNYVPYLQEPQIAYVLYFKPTCSAELCKNQLRLNAIRQDQPLLFERLHESMRPAGERRLPGLTGMFCMVLGPETGLWIRTFYGICALDGSLSAPVTRPLRGVGACVQASAQRIQV